MFNKLGRSGTYNWLAVSILAIHVFLGVLYSVVTPLWESFDEWGHYPYVEHIAQEHRLPQERLAESNDETHQPPLYYILGALATFWIDTSDDLQMVENEYSVHRGGQGGVSFYLHLEDEQFPYRATVLAAHVTRLVSVLLGTVSVLATYLTANTLFGDRNPLALGAMAVSAFWPQLLFMGGVINNDIMVTASASVVLLFSVRILVHGLRPQDLLGLGLSLGATLFSKRNGLALVPFVFLSLLVTANEQRQNRSTSSLLLAGTLVFAIGMTVTSIWAFDSMRDPYQAHLTHVLSALLHPAKIMQLHWERLPSGLYFCLVTFFASFGHLLLGVEAWIYQLVVVFCLAACLGLLAFVISKRQDRLTRIGVLILVFHVLAVLAAPAYRVLTQGAEPASPTIIGSIQSSSPLLFSKNVFLFQGRFALPAISSFSILLVLGLSSLVPERFQTTVLASVSLVLLVFSTLAPFRYIFPAYARPKQLSASEMEQMEPLHIQFGKKIELLGYKMEADEALSGSTVPLTLYWRCLSEMEQDYDLTIEILGPESRVYGALRLHPGHGNFPTSLWEEGESFREAYRISIDRNVPTPSWAYFKVSFRSGDSTRDRLITFDAEGNRTSATFGQLIVRASDIPQIEHRIHYELDGKVALVGYRIDPPPKFSRELEVTLYWQALADMETDYTVFVHLIDEQGQLVNQVDSQPRNGLFPTSIWREGEVIKDKHTVSLPPTISGERYSIRLGLYDLLTMERLPAFDHNGSRMLHDVIVLKDVQLSPRR